MNLSTIWKRLSSAIRPKPKFLRDNAGKITEAFTHEGITYYMFADVFSMPTVRGLQALDYYDEFSMRCTKDYLQKHVAAMKALLSPEQGKRLELIKLATLVKHLEERLTMIPVPEHIYRLASVAFFDGTEDPFFFDRAYAKKKVERWKRSPEVLSFFLSTSLKDLIPYSDLGQVNLNTFSAIVDRINEVHLSEVSSILSESGMNIDM